MEGDAIGGTTNLIIREASNEPTIYANVSTVIVLFFLIINSTLLTIML